VPCKKENATKESREGEKSFTRAPWQQFEDRDSGVLTGVPNVGKSSFFNVLSKTGTMFELCDEKMGALSS